MKLLWNFSYWYKYTSVFRLLHHALSILPSCGDRFSSLGSMGNDHICLPSEISIFAMMSDSHITRPETTTSSAWEWVGRPPGHCPAIHRKQETTWSRQRCQSIPGLLCRRWIRRGTYWHGFHHLPNTSLNKHRIKWGISNSVFMGNRTIFGKSSPYSTADLNWCRPNAIIWYSQIFACYQRN